MLFFVGFGIGVVLEKSPNQLLEDKEVEGHAEAAC
jgi:hypothetical protein